VNAIDGTLPVSVVIPVRDRPHLLQRFLPTYAGQGCAELLVLDDGRRSPVKRQDLDSWTGGGARLITLSRPHSLQEKRNLAAGLAEQPHLFMGHDDVYLAPGHVRALLGQLRSGGYDMVAGTWLFTGLDDLDEACRLAGTLPVATDANELVDMFTFYFHGARRVDRSIEAPWLTDVALIRRHALDRVAYDTGYRGNDYRCETDLYLCARRAGLRMAFVPGPPAFHYKGPDNTGGGYYPWRGLRQLLWYEWWVAVNTQRFLRKNRDQLLDLGWRLPPFLHTLALMASRYREWPDRLRGR
jgi:GT2 family glycosyltransferase